jgi:hypothetical protein
MNKMEIDELLEFNEVKILMNKDDLKNYISYCRNGRMYFLSGFHHLLTEKAQTNGINCDLKCISNLNFKKLQAITY